MLAPIVRGRSGHQNREGKQRPVTLTPIFTGFSREDLPEEPPVFPVDHRARWARQLEPTPVRDFKFHAEDPKDISTEIKVGPVVFRLPDRQPAKKKSAFQIRVSADNITVLNSYNGEQFEKPPEKCMPAPQHSAGMADPNTLTMGAQGAAIEVQKLIRSRSRLSSENALDCAEEEVAAIEIQVLRRKQPDRRHESQDSAVLLDLASEYRCKAKEKVQAAEQLEARAASIYD